MNYSPVTFKDFKMNVRLDIGYQDVKVCNEVFYGDPYKMRELAEMVDPKVVLDVGGHIGCFGVMARKLWPDCELIAIEPSVDNHRLYVENLKINDLYNPQKCLILNRALSYSDRHVLVKSPRTTGGHVLMSKEDADRVIKKEYRLMYNLEEEHVDTVTIEDLKLKRVDLAKWDCEGGEQEAFKNLTCPDIFKFMVGEFHISGNDYLKPSLFDIEKFWRETKKKFNHLIWDYDAGILGTFRAGPKCLD